MIKFPDNEKMHEFAHMIRMREPLAEDVIGFMDGLSLPWACDPDEYIQNSYYNAYHADTMVNNVMAYGPDGKGFLAALNFPGSWHDSAVIMELIGFLKDQLQGYRICVDQGFPRSGDAYDILVGLYSEKTVRKLSEALPSSIGCSLHISEASFRVGFGLHGTFPRIKSRLPSSSSTRYLILTRPTCLL